MSTRRLVFSCLFFVGCAAGVEDSGFGTFNMPTTTPTSGASSQSGDDSGDDTDASDTSGSGEGSDEESTADDTTTGPTTTTDPTNTTDPSTTGSDTMSDDDTTTGMGGGMMIDVQNHDGSCEDVVWCTDSTTMEGVGPHAYAECFTNVGLTPPFDVVEVRYHVGALQATPTVASLQILSWSGLAPGGVLGTQSLGANDMTVGSHTLVLNNPVTVNTTSFCVAVTGNDAFGISRDESNSVPNVSFVQADQCSLVSYNTLASIGFPGNLCMSAKVAN